MAQEVIDIVTTIGKIVLPSIIKSIPKIFKSSEKKKTLIDFVFEIYAVVQKTHFHIKQNKGKYIKSRELYKDYMNLLKLNEMLRNKNIPVEIPEYLESKAKFWINPKAHLNDPELLQHVPSLKQIEKKCKNILYKL
jgi:hypothetical protein